jgi:hypothetical protein
MASTEEALKQIVGALRPPPDGTDVQARDAALLARLRDWVAEFGTPPKELRAERKQRRKAGDAREAALLKVFSRAEAAWRAMEDNDEAEVIRRIFEGFAEKRLFVDNKQEEVWRLDFTTARVCFLILCQAFEERRQETAIVSDLAVRHPQRRPQELAKRRAIRELAKIYEESTGSRPTITVAKGFGHERCGDWYLFATAVSEITWGGSSGGVVCAVTEELRSALQIAPIA